MVARGALMLDGRPNAVPSFSISVQWPTICIWTAHLLSDVTDTGCVSE